MYVSCPHARMRAFICIRIYVCLMHAWMYICIYTFPSSTTFFCVRPDLKDPVEQLARFDLKKFHVASLTENSDCHDVLAKSGKNIAEPQNKYRSISYGSDCHEILAKSGNKQISVRLCVFSHCIMTPSPPTSQLSTLPRSPLPAKNIEKH